MTTSLNNFSLIDRLDQAAIVPDTPLPLLATHQVIPNLLGESIIAQAINSITCTVEETAQACTLLYEQWGLISVEQQTEWRSRYRLSQEQIATMATRSLRLEKFIETSWGHRLESYFLQHKHNLDRVIYSLIRHRDRDVMNELYFRIVEGEQSLAELASEYSQGQEAQTGGYLGPLEMASLNPDLAKLLYYAPVGEVQQPKQLGDWYAIVRVEQWLPAQLDEAIRQRQATMRLQDGRALAWSEWGAAEGLPVLFCTGAAMSGSLGFGADDVSQLGLRLIAIDRSGLGASDPHPDKTLASWVMDIREFIQFNHLHHVTTVGFSQGAVFALALAAAGLVEAIAIVSGQDELMHPQIRPLLHPDVHQMLIAIEQDAVAFEQHFAQIATWEDMWQFIVDRSAERDRQLYLSDSFSQAFQRSLQEGCAQGTQGYTRDLVNAISVWRSR